MIPRDILKKIRRLEIRTNLLEAGLSVWKRRSKS